MAEFSVKIDASGVSRKMILLVDATKDINAPLRQFGKYLRNKSKQKFANEGPGWEPLADSTKERLEHTRTGRITAQGKIRASVVPKIQRYLKTSVKDLVKQELKVKHRFNSNLELALLRKEKQERQLKTLEKLESDIEKMKAKPLDKRRRGKKAIEKHKLLGRLASTLTAEVKNSVLVVRSKAGEIGKIHNEGGVAGHGAKIPARTFLELDDDDVKVLKALLEHHLLASIEG